MAAKDVKQNGDIVRRRSANHIRLAYKGQRASHRKRKLLSAIYEQKKCISNKCKELEAANGQCDFHTKLRDFVIIIIVLSASMVAFYLNSPFLYVKFISLTA